MDGSTAAKALELPAIIRPVIPKFPEFLPVGFAQKPALEEIARRFAPFVEFNFTVLHLFDHGTAELSNLREDLVLRITDPASGERFCTLLGENQVEDTLLELLHRERKQSSSQRATLRAVSDKIAAAAPNIPWEEQPELFEYVYSTEAMISANAESLRCRRRLAKRFARRQPGVLLHPLDLGDSTTCARLEALMGTVMLQRPTLDRSLLAEMRALVRCIASVRRLGCIGFGIQVEGSLAAFNIIEPVHDGWYHAHFNKARRDLPGAMEFLMIETAAEMRRRGYRLQNDHEDLGLPGLRSFKESWAPVRLLKKYRAADRLI